jgi:hypothetical protein
VVYVAAQVGIDALEFWTKISLHEMNAEGRPQKPRAL